MNRISTILPPIVLCLLASCSSIAQENWPQFRGANAGGIGLGSPPAEWDVTSRKNIQWKTPIDGLGLSSPIVWGNHIFLTTAVSANTDKPALKTGWLGGTGEPADDSDLWTWKVICLDLETGKTHWSKDVCSGKPEIKRHLKASHANCTPATDGKSVVAFFGSEGLYCLDFEGSLKWEKNFGRLHSGPYNSKELEWGFASSPVIHEGHVIVQCDCLNTGFVAIIDLNDGREIARIKRDDVSTWSTPCVVKINGRSQIVCNGYKQMAGYDLATREQLWTLSGGGDVPVPTPLFHDNLFLITNGHGRRPTFAISVDARGDLTPDKESGELPSGLVWHQHRDGSYMPTPIAVNGLLYTCSDDGILAVREVKTGELVYKQRVSTGTNNFSASAVATKDHLFFSSEQGKVTVVKAGRKYELISTNDMQSAVMATPAICGNRLLIRTVDEVVCIGHEK